MIGWGVGGSTVLRAEAVRAVVVAVGAQRQDDLLDVVGVVAEVRPGLAAGEVGEGVVHLGDVGGGVEVGDVGAEVPEVIGAVGGVPVQFLWRVGIGNDVLDARRGRG